MDDYSLLQWPVVSWSDLMDFSISHFVKVCAFWKVLIQKFGVPVLPIGTNDVSIFGTEKMRRGKEHPSIGRLFENSKVDNDGRNVLEELVRNIVDAKRRQIGVLLEELA